MRSRIIPAFLFLLAVSVSFTGCTDMVTNPVTNPEIAVMEVVAGKISASVNSEFSEINSGLLNTSTDLAISGLSGPEAERLLRENLRRHPWAVSSRTVAGNGAVQAAVPLTFGRFTGRDISMQPAVKKALANRTPGLSGVFLMEEGVLGVAQSYPVISQSGEYLGYVDITYAPEDFLDRHVVVSERGNAYDVWVAQTDGTVIYDSTKEEVGRNILTDPVYSDPALKKTASQILRESSGTTTYTFFNRAWNRNVTKTAVWDTAETGGMAWRVVVTSEADKKRVTPTTLPASRGIAADARYANLTGFVDRALVYAQENGRDVALREFNDVNGTFIEGDLYVFAYDMNGTVIALPYQQALLGMDRTGITDSNGVKFIDRMRELAKEGGGSIYYTYPNPQHDYREEFKYATVRPVDDAWFVGAGLYIPELPTEFNYTERERLVERVTMARDYATEQGAQNAIAGFNDIHGSFATGGHYIFAYGYDGTTLALPFQPELIGTNRMDFADTNGIKIIPWEISVAKQGGGFVYVEYLNPDTGATGLKLCYVVPVDDGWFVGSGIYADG